MCQMIGRCQFSHMLCRDLDTRVETFNPLELRERVFGNRLRSITTPTTSWHIVLQRWQLIYSLCKSGLNSQTQSQFPLEIIRLLALVMLAIDACANIPRIVQPGRDGDHYLPAEIIVY